MVTLIYLNSIIQIKFHKYRSNKSTSPSDDNKREEKENEPLSEIPQ